MRYGVLLSLGGVISGCGEPNVVELDAVVGGSSDVSSAVSVSISAIAELFGMSQLSHENFRLALFATAGGSVPDGGPLIWMALDEAPSESASEFSAVDDRSHTVGWIVDLECGDDCTYAMEVSIASDALVAVHVDWWAELTAVGFGPGVFDARDHVSGLELTVDSAAF